MKEFVLVVVMYLMLLKQLDAQCIMVDDYHEAQNIAVASQVFNC